MNKLRSPLTWVGSKRLLRDEILTKIPPHTCYVEAFAGAAWVYLGKEPSETEVLNDINDLLVNLYRQIQSNPDAFYEKLRCLVPHARVEFQRLRAILRTNPYSVSDLERAVYYFYVLKNAFGGRMNSGFAFSKVKPPRAALTYEILMALSDRLRNTHIEHLSFERLLKNYDHEGAFFYCDPPYTMTAGKSDYYEHNFTTEQHIELYNCLSTLKGKFLLSYDDSPFTRELYKDFRIEQTKPIAYTLNQTRKIKHELLICNY